MHGRWFIAALACCALAVGCDDGDGDTSGADMGVGGAGGEGGGAGGEGGGAGGEGGGAGGEGGGAGGEGGGMTPPFGQADDIEMANAVWAEIEGHQQNWPQPAEKAGWVEGAMPHGGWQQIYQNGTDPAADGYIVLKRNYGMQDEGALGAITVMKKVAGYDAEINDWFFAKYLPDGTLDMNPAGVPLAGRVGKGGDMGCIPCHSGAAGGDYLHSFDGPEIPSVPMGRPWDTAQAAEIWAEIADHQDWAAPEGFDGWQQGAMPHGAWQQYHHNGDDIAADGYTIIKRNHAMEDEGTLEALTVMKKMEGFDADIADWFFVKYLPDGSLDVNPAGVPLAGRVGKGGAMGCVPCHSGAPGNDYLFSQD